MGKRKHGHQLRILIEDMGLTQDQAAELLRYVTDDDSPSLRTLRTWLADSGANTKGKCPGWAVYILRTEKEKRK